MINLLEPIPALRIFLSWHQKSIFVRALRARELMCYSGRRDAAGVSRHYCSGRTGRISRSTEDVDSGNRRRLPCVYCRGLRTEHLLTVQSFDSCPGFVLSLTPQVKVGWQSAESSCWSSQDDQRTNKNKLLSWAIYRLRCEWSSIFSTPFSFVLLGYSLHRPR